VTWTIYAQLADNSPAINAEWLMSGLSGLFGARPEFAVRQTSLPFSRAPSVDLVSGTWLARLTYEEGDAVLADSIEIRRVTREDPSGQEASTRRIRAVLSSDEAGEYTNHSIWVTDFLRSIPGVLLFDVTRNEYF